MAKHDKQDDTPFAVNVAGTVAALGAAFLAQKVISAAWQSVSGSELPSEDDDEAQLTKIVVAAALSGAIVALARVSAARGARNYARKRLEK